MGAAGIARRKKIPFIMEVRDLWPAIFVDLGIIKNKAIIRLLEKWELGLYASATSIVTVTEAFRQNLIERGIPEHKVFMIPNGADVNYWNPEPIDSDLRKLLNIDKEAFVVLYIGAHGISHALSSILESAKMLENFNDIVFVFVGDGAEKIKLKERSKELNLGNIRFIDPVEKERVKEYYAMADACLVPLRNIPLFDTFIPSKMFEMMAMARPVIASVRGEAAEILNAAGGAIIVQPEDSEAISQSILSLRENPILRKSLGAAGREYVINNYSRQQLSAKYALILEESIKRYKETK
jgi:glycosyltransferase involved in cell wall biosynthesis